jgi:hypothetical protein
MLMPRVSTPQSQFTFKLAGYFSTSQVLRSYPSLIGSYSPSHRLLFSGSSIQPSHASQLEKISDHLVRSLLTHVDQIRLTEICFIRTTFNLHSSSSDPYHFRGNFLQLPDELYCTWDAREKNSTALDGISIAPSFSSSEANKH